MAAKTPAAQETRPVPDGEGDGTPVRREILPVLLGLKGGLPSHDARWHGDARHDGHGLAVETGTVRTGDRILPGILLRPRATPGGSAILYCHAHGDRYGIGARETVDGRPALLDPPTAKALAAAGHVVLCIDMPGFGTRQGEGTESVLAKAALWQGKPLFGRQLAELSCALTALAAMPEVDPARIGAFGLSMGATHAYWLAALDDRIAAVAHLCAFSGIGPLIASGAHDQHGHYMTVPGLLAHGDMGDVAALVAPRPQLVGWGTQDPLTPPDALAPALTRLRAAYAGCPDRLVTVEAQGAGHEETPAMRHAVLDFLARHLAP